MFLRDRFEVLYSSMLHVAPTDEKEKKDKIEPFFDALLEKFKAVFYPGENLSLLDEMVVKWKGRSKIQDV